MNRAEEKLVAPEKTREGNRQAQKELDRVLRAFSHPTRRQILLNLKIRGEAMSSGEIASRYSCKWPTITRHLGVLKSAGLIVVTREGNHLIYRLNMDAFRRVWKNWFSHFGIGEK